MLSYKYIHTYILHICLMLRYIFHWIEQHVASDYSNSFKIWNNKRIAQFLESNLKNEVDHLLNKRYPLQRIPSLPSTDDITKILIVFLLMRIIKFKKKYSRVKYENWCLFKYIYIYTYIRRYVNTDMTCSKTTM